MNDRSHPNHPDYQAPHSAVTGELDEDVTGQEILDPISIGALATLQRVEIDQQVATAKAYPRNVSKLKQELTALVTMDEDTADDCIYALPRGKKHIKGPSARFADALISYWGNARSGSFITQVNRDEKFVEAIGSFQDVERNVIRQRRVRRPIVSSEGRLYNADMINMTGNAACVIAERNAILNGIPKSLWSGAYEQAFSLVAGTTKTLGEKLQRVEKAFMLHGIAMPQVLEKLGYQDAAKIVPDDIVTLRGMLNALRDGTETVETIFGRGAGSTHEHVKSPLKDDPAETVMRTVADARSDNVKAAAADPISSGRMTIRDTSTVSVGTDGKLTPNSPEGEQQVDSGGKSSDKPLEDKGEGTGDQSKTASTNRAATEKPAQELSGDAGTDTPAGQETAQASPTGAGKAVSEPENPYTDAASYIAFMEAGLTAAKAGSAVTELWGSTRADRADLLNDEQLDDLTEKKAARIRALKKGAS